tara:strand:+ start:48 stop:830 length:783 start_codon:yes stop_codon:yes gene_type:complete
MHWINIHTETLRGEEFLGAEPLERATWLSLLGWCCAQENSGTITGCGDWSSRKWQQICGVTLEEVNTESQLYNFDEGNLIVHFYPLEHQEKAEASRVNGKKGGRPKKTASHETLTQQGDKPIGSILVNPDLNLEETQSEPRANPNSNSNSKSKSNCNSNTPVKPKFIPPTLEDFTTYLQESLPKINPEWTPERITRASQLQHETYTDQEWHTGGDKPRKIKNWRTTTKNSMKHQKPWQFGSAPTQQQKPLPSDVAEYMGE